MTSPTIPLTVDGRRIEARPGQTILDAADEAGVYIPRLCWMKQLLPFGSCRVCTVRVNGRPQAACTQPVAPGMVIENDTAELRELRRDLIDMLFVEGNHFCMFCAKSGNCELQALAYRFGPACQAHPATVQTPLAISEGTRAHMAASQALANQIYARWRSRWPG